MNRKLENIKKLEVSKPLKLDCGKTINNFPLAYETYGKLNENKDNAILVFHALTGDQFVAETNPVTNKEGWWVTAVGPGKAIDTKKYFVICANVIGGCMGSLGPRNINPENKNKKKIFISIHPWTLNLNKDNRWYRNIDDYNFMIKKITNSNEEKMTKVIQVPMAKPCFCFQSYSINPVIFD